MKHPLILTTALCLSISSISLAQSSFFHAGLGVSGGTDGVSAGVLVGLGKHIQVRGEYGLTPQLSKDFAATIQNIDVNVNASTSLGRSRVLLDLFPSANSSFHFTVGAYFGDDVIATAVTDPLPEEYRSVGIESNLDSDYSFKTDDQGRFVFNAKARGLRPYAGIGWGGILSKAVSLSLDLGVQYIGEGTGLYGKAADLLGNEKELRLCSADFNNADQGYLDKLAQLPVYPVLSLHLYIRLF